MSESPRPIDRRVFLRTSAAITTAGALGMPAAGPREAAGSAPASTVEPCAAGSSANTSRAGCRWRPRPPRRKDTWGQTGHVGSDV